MAKKLTGIKFGNQIEFTNRTIAFDKSGVPWLIDPERGTISLATIVMPDDKQSAVVKKKRK